MSAPTDLAARYGTPSPWRNRVLLGALVVVVGAFLGWVGWTYWSEATPEVRSELLSYDVVDAHRVTAHVRVVLSDEDVRASCTLRAYAEDHSVVGELAFAPEGSGRSDRTIRTERLATSVELLGCTAPGQNRPR